MTDTDPKPTTRPPAGLTRQLRPVYPLAAEGAGHIVRRALMAAPTRNARPEYMRELNLLIVLDAFRTVGEMSRASVARATGISAPTASKSVQQLIEAGLLVEEGRASGRIGKPATRVRFNAVCGSVLGVDLGGTHLRLALSDLAGGISARTIETIDPNAGPEGVMGRIEAIGKALLAETGAPLMAIGLATPGIVDTEEGVVGTARNLKGWHNVPIRRMLETAFGVPAVVENDVNAAAMGERWRGAARGHESFLFVAIGTGIGAGLVLDGEIYRGAHFAAGEINLLPVGTPGNEGYLEDRASGPAIVRRALEFGYEPAYGEDASTDGVFAAAANRDAAAMRAVEEGVAAIAFGTGVLLAAVDPSIVVIGGGVSSQGAGILDPLREAIARVVRLRCDVVLSELGVDAQLHGAVFVGLKRADLALVDRVSGPSSAIQNSAFSPEAL
jgi:predicted NBD/HSP70 family sugar kinase